MTGVRNPQTNWLSVVSQTVPDFIVTMLTIILSVVMTIELAIEASVLVALVFLLLRLALPAYSLLARDPLSGEWTSVKEMQAGSKRMIVAPPGILIFRLEESLIYPNSNRIRTQVSDVMAATTKDLTPAHVEISGRSQQGKAWSEYTGRWERQEMDVEFGELVGGVVGEWQASMGIGEGRSSGSGTLGIGIQVSESESVSSSSDGESKETKANAIVVTGGLTVPDPSDPLYNSGAKSTASTAFSRTDASEAPIISPVSVNQKPSFADSDKPPLRALIFDFSAVNTVDSTGAQTLLDLLADANRRSGDSGGVQMHFVHARRRVREVLERSGVIAAQIPVPVADENGVKLEKVEIAASDPVTSGKKEGLNFDPWRTVKGLKFNRRGSKGLQQAASGAAAAVANVNAELPSQPLGAGTGTTSATVTAQQPAIVVEEPSHEVSIDVPAAPLEAPPISRPSISGALPSSASVAGENATALSGIQEAALTTPDEVIEATGVYSARFMHSNVDDAIESIEEMERERAGGVIA